MLKGVDVRNLYFVDLSWELSIYVHASSQILGCGNSCHFSTWSPIADDFFVVNVSEAVFASSTFTVVEIDNVRD